ncbi:hypothetical protein F2S72_09505 [Pseudomonas syringae pv. actinidiae]|nr:hypothetical protein [Pseudomonas syringae pv. actinidiae]
MNNLVRTLMQSTPVECLRRIQQLTSERSRKQESLPAKTFAWVSVLLSLLAAGLNAGFTSLPFILLVICASLLAGITLLGAWGLQSNLRNSVAAHRLLAQKQ